MPPKSTPAVDTTPPPAPAAAPAPAPPAAPAEQLERLSPAKWAERRWPDKAERKAKAWLLAMVEHARTRAEAETGEAPGPMTEAEFDEALGLAAGHQVVQHHTQPKGKE